MEISSEDVSYFIEKLNRISEYDFTSYSEKSITRRIEKVVTDNNMDAKSLIDKMEKSRDFLIKIVKDITVNTTELFRDPKIWHTIRYSILPVYKNKEKISIWHAGSSSGQEIYSMLILLYEMELFDKSDIYGTDINEDMVIEARKGIYKYRFNLDYLDNFNKVIRENPYNIDEYKDVPYEKYLEINKSNDTIKVLPFLLNKPEFRVHDLVKDRNIFNTEFDIIICRNVLIYFNNNLQNKVFDLFHKSLRPGGYLILGLHESMLGPISDKFDKKGLIYQKKLVTN
ncbi:MAG: CheR family methyltransferase [Bacteroidota bacterium]